MTPDLAPSEPTTTNSELQADAAKKPTAKKPTAKKPTAKKPTAVEEPAVTVPDSDNASADGTAPIRKPEWQDGYLAWLRDSRSVHLTPSVQTRYESVAELLVGRFSVAPFWTDFLKVLRNADSQYYVDTKTRYRLLAPSNADAPLVLAKPYDSLVLKTFRMNVLNNVRWPEPPDGGWVVPNTWLAEVKDVVRTLVVVKYLDGVDIVVKLLQDVAKSHGLLCLTSYEARDEGYYAVHVTVTLVLSIPGERWELEPREISVEIQVSTQVQDVIRVLTHQFYEERRRQAKSAAEKWQWNYRSAEFIPNYLGHILHYVEGMIMEIRDKQEQQSDS